MIKRFVPLFSLLLITAACSTSKRATGTANPGMTTGMTSTPKPTDDGLSFATAIVITEKTENTGVQAEYDWIRQHYENYKVQKQVLSYRDKKPYDIITIRQADGKNLDLYFDITNYFGKF